MSEESDTPMPRPDTAAGASEAPRAPARGRLSRRGAAALAAGMLALGVGVGAAIGPAPSASFAGISPSLLQRLPGLLAAVASAGEHAASAPSTGEEAGAASAAEAARARRLRRRRERRAAAASSPAAASPAAGEGEASSAPTAAKKRAGKSAKLPAISSVWLIELGGESFIEAQAQPASAPYITGTLLHEGVLLSGWNALQASALASEAALLAPVSEGASPPLVRSIVQPPCPEGAAGAACSNPAGELVAADAFLKETLAQITTTSAYREHGLVVVTFATVGVAAEQGLPAGASSATLTDTPPAGVLVLSPFAKHAAHASLRFNPTSPSQSLQALLG